MHETDDLSDRQRKIIHIDMDAFYASVEQRDDPALRGRPVAVGGTRERGVVAAASYEARRFGVRSAMSSAAARRRCPELVFVKPRFDVYKEISRQIRAIFAAYTPLIEPLSLDEAYLDVTENLPGIASATEIAAAIRRRIRDETGLTASAGVSYNKLLAKLASDQNKPDGLCVVTPRRGPAFVAAMPVGKFHGIGPVTAARMNRMGIHTGLDLRVRDRAFLAEHFGRSADYYYLAARGIDYRPVRPNRERKSIGSETTFFTDLTRPEEIAAALEAVMESLWPHVERTRSAARTVTLKVKYSDFQIVTRSRTLERSTADRTIVSDIAQRLAEGLFPLAKPVRLLGIALSNLAPPIDEPERQLGLAL